MQSLKVLSLRPGFESTRFKEDDFSAQTAGAHWSLLITHQDFNMWPTLSSDGKKPSVLICNVLAWRVFTFGIGTFGF